MTARGEEVGDEFRIAGDSAARKRSFLGEEEVANEAMRERFQLGGARRIGRSSGRQFAGAIGRGGDAIDEPGLVFMDEMDEAIAQRAQVPVEFEEAARLIIPCFKAPFDKLAESVGMRRGGDEAAGEMPAAEPIGERHDMTDFVIAVAFERAALLIDHDGLEDKPRAPSGLQAGVAVETPLLPLGPQRLVDRRRCHDEKDGPGVGIDREHLDPTVRHPAD